MKTGELAGIRIVLLPPPSDALGIQRNSLCISKLGPFFPPFRNTEYLNALCLEGAGVCYFSWGSAKILCPGGDAFQLTVSNGEHLAYGSREVVTLHGGQT